tara:strand:+ start:3662 stop:4558 length:897 start_codon:yes stop_codon:yes gene_type:complete
VSSNQAPTYGGQAVLEGVMIRGQNNVSVAVRSPSGEIKTQIKPIANIFRSKYRKTPLIRGIIALIETLIIGMNALNFSSAVAMEEENSDPNRASIVLMITISFTLAIGLFFMLPLLISTPFEGFLGSNIFSNIIEGIVRLLIFIGYIYVIGLMPDIKRVFMYHGAEHMTVHAQENNLELNLANIKKYPTAHPRCGTAFLLTIMLIAVIVFILIPRQSLLIVVGSRIVLVPFIASLSYEFIRLSSIYQNNFIMKAISAPSLWLQSLTTRQPDDDQIEVAVIAMQSAIEADKDASSSSAT